MKGVCIQCGCEFESEFPRRYCGDRCRRRFSYEKHREVKIYHRVCKECGAEFETENFHAAYCSKKCYKRYWHRHDNVQKKARRHQNPKRLMHKRCGICGCEYETIFKTQKYCSDECKRAAEVEAQAKRQRKHSEEGKKLQPVTAKTPEGRQLLAGNEWLKAQIRALTGRAKNEEDLRELRGGI